MSLSYKQCRRIANILHNSQTGRPEKCIYAIPSPWIYSLYLANKTPLPVGLNVEYSSLERRESNYRTYKRGCSSNSLLVIFEYHLVSALTTGQRLAHPTLSQQFGRQLVHCCPTAYIGHLAYNYSSS